MENEDIALYQKADGTFDIEFDTEGNIKTIDNGLSFALHNLLCYGRADKQTIITPEERQGYIGSYLSGSDLYSVAWLYYREQNMTSLNISSLLQKLNSSLERDYRKGFFAKKVAILQPVKIDKDKLQITFGSGINVNQVNVSL